MNGAACLNDEDRERIVDLYESRYAELGNDVRTLGWNTREDQRLRFEVLCDIGDLGGRSICDIGCGFADLYPYLLERFGYVDYTGIDLAPSLCDQARQLHPDARILCRDLLREGLGESFDYVLLSGALNLRVADWRMHATAMIAKMYAMAHYGVAYNCLTTHVNFQREHNRHWDPADALRHGLSLTPAVAVRHDYPLWEFTVHLHKKEAVR